MLKRNFSIAVIVLLSLISGIASADDLLSNNAKAALNTNIELSGNSSVIIEYKSSNALLAAKGLDQIAAVQSMHQQFKSSLSAEMANNISSSFKYIPGMVMSVDDNQLEEILANDMVERVYPNKVRRITLQESLGIVLPGSSKDEFSGKGQTIAIIDTGVDNSHDFFKTGGISRIVSEACYTGGSLSGFREVRVLCPNRSREQVGTGAGDDCTALGFSGCDHGTHVAGIAAGNDGVANEANIIAIQVFTGLEDVFRRNVCGTGRGNNCIVAFDSDIIKGLERVFALRNTYNIAAVNMSLGGGRHFSSCDAENPLMTNIIGQLKNAGIATTVSSGNNGYSDSVSFPSCITNAITVGATSDFSGTAFGRNIVIDERIFYSNQSSTVDVFAPGTSIRSSIPGNQFADFNGTSMAAPHVAAGFAVVKAEQNTLSVDQIETAFKSTGSEVVDSGVTRRRINVLAALRRLGLAGSGVSTATLQLLMDDDSDSNDDSN